MRSNWWRWLWGIVPLLLLGWIAVEAEHVRIERDLNARSAQALAAAGLAWASTGYQGRDGQLAGRATDVSDPDKALGILQNVWGVRIVDNRAELIEQVENYVWAASRRNNRIRLTGFVPNTKARQEILGVVRASFPGFEIQDRTKLARGVPGLDAWLGGVSYGLKQLTSLKHGDARIEGLTVTVVGEAEDVNGYRAVRSALASGLPRGLKLGATNVVAPLVAPHVWAATYNGRQMAFRGNVPGDAEQAAVLAAAREKLGDAAITDDAEPGSGAAAGWQDAAVLAIRQLVRLESGGVEFKDAHLTLSGTAPDDATAQSIRDAFKTLPASVKLIDALQVKEQPRVVDNSTAPEPAKQAEAPKEERRAEPADPQAGGAPGASEDKTQVVEQTRPKVEARVETKVETKADATPVRSADTAPKPEAKSETLPAQTPKVEAQPVQPKASTTITSSTQEIRAARACEDKLTSLATAGTLLFRYSSAELVAGSTETLDKLATAAKDCPGMVIEIGGYASAEGAPVSNLRLSLLRARTVLDYLVKAGVDANQLEAKGYGIARPVAPNTTSENMARNRRIEFTVRPRGEVKSGG